MNDPRHVRALARLSGGGRPSEGGGGRDVAEQVPSRDRPPGDPMTARIPFTPDDEGAIRTLMGTMLFLMVVNFAFGGLGRIENRQYRFGYR